MEYGAESFSAMGPLMARPDILEPPIVFRRQDHSPAITISSSRRTIRVRSDTATRPGEVRPIT
jgi:hypothetical protein